MSKLSKKINILQNNTPKKHKKTHNAKRTRFNIKKIGIKIITLIFISISATLNPVQVSAEKSEIVSLNNDYIKAKSAILIEQSTGKTLYEQEKDKKLQIASVTKIMTMLIALESLDSGKIHENDIVTVSEHASTMGGSQVYLEPGEKISVDDLMKAIIISSGNDAAVTLAEHISGSHDAFVELMNKRAKELNLENTHFINCNGLDETNEHYSTAYDLAIISKEILNHERVFKYTETWMDTIREGKFGLSNTNKLLKSYEGTTGIKTGSTNIAEFCIAASSKRDDMHLITIILGSSSSKERFDAAKKLMNYGFSNFSIVNAANELNDIKTIPVKKGEKNTVTISTKNNKNFVVPKGEKNKIQKKVELKKPITAPVKPGQKIGKITFTLNNEEIASADITSNEEIKRINLSKMLTKISEEWIKIITPTEPLQTQLE